MRPINARRSSSPAATVRAVTLAPDARLGLASPLAAATAAQCVASGILPLTRHAYAALIERAGDPAIWSRRRSLSQVSTCCARPDREVRDQARTQQLAGQLGIPGCARVGDRRVGVAVDTLPEARPPVQLRFELGLEPPQLSEHAFTQQRVPAVAPMVDIDRIQQLRHPCERAEFLGAAAPAPARRRRAGPESWSRIAQRRSQTRWSALSAQSTSSRT